MQLDLITAVYITCLIYGVQVIAVYLQYRINKNSDRGIREWLIGSALIALGYFLMPMVKVPALLLLAEIANPLVILGQVFLYVGILRFFEIRIHYKRIAWTYGVFLLAYFYLIHVAYSISGRVVVVAVTLSIFTFLPAYHLFFHKNRFSVGSARFTGAVFLIRGLYSATQGMTALLLPPLTSYSQMGQDPILVLAFIFPLVDSILWTYGFLIMVNQRLNAEKDEDQQMIKSIFDASPVAVLTKRLSDGCFLEVNEGFLQLFDYTRSEIIGKSTETLALWDDSKDNESYLEEIREKGCCTNYECKFRVKNGRVFIGSISTRSVTVQGEPHLVSVIQDVTEKKLFERKNLALVKQLESERNSALQASVTDGLTGLPNRRCLDSHLDAYFEKANQTDLDLSVIMLDVDHFKDFNDLYGHLAGDECLKAIGALLEQHVERSTGLAARYGGEEFAVILHETSSQEAYELAEKIRRAVEKMAIPHKASSVSDYVTVSAGVASFMSTKPFAAGHLLEKADHALYQAKRMGRNHTTLAQTQA